MNDGPRTHFGRRQVSEEEKTRLVGGVFSSVADRYDLMNDLMSAGVHRAWKKFAVARAQVQPGQRVLDVAGGSGDLTRAFSRQVGDEGRVVLSDINSEMLNRGRDRLIDTAVVDNVDYVQANAESLPFEAGSFHCISISFGLRNVTRIDRALESMCAVLKPGGRLIVLEFSRPVSTGLSKLYDFYSFAVVPKLGRWVADDEASYQYLVESIRRHPDQDTLKSMMLDAGFDDVVYHNMSGGIVALHVGFKY